MLLFTLQDTHTRREKVGARVKVQGIAKTRARQRSVRRCARNG